MGSPSTRLRQPQCAGPALLALVLTLVGAAILAPMLTYPFGSGQGSFSNVANVIGRGGVPYRQVWENKPSGICYLFWAIFAAGTLYVERAIGRPLVDALGRGRSGDW
jgi:hypothetical protein